DGTQLAYGHGIHLRTRGTASLKNIKIINNVINNAIKSGIYVEDGADVSNIVAKNNIIVNNGEYGIYGNVLSSYNDVWNNNAGNYGGGASAGKGDISADPLFASPPHDFHLKSQAGRWNGSAWVVDNVTSPCIDAGVPFEEDPVYGDYRNELPPNGSRINMGAYGNTREASMSVEMNTYSISGYVKYENGTGIFNAYVTNNRTSVEDYTDENGYYILHGLPNGTYLITASAGSLSNSIVVTIAGRDIENANITLTGEPPQIISFTPSDLTPTQYVNRTYTFSVTVSQPVSNAWFLDGEDQHNNAQSWTHTWEHTGVHNVTYIGTNENGTVSLTWTVNVTPLPSPNETLVYISPSSKVVKRGASFNISIYVEPGEEIAGMQANLIFDPSFVHVNSVAEGDLLRNSGLPTFFIPGKINNTAGFVKDIACTILGKGNVSSPGTFAIINMTAGNLSGTSPLKIEGVKVTNSYAQLLPHNISNGTLIVNDPPVLMPIGDKTVYEGSLLEFTVSAYDPDNDTLSFTASNLPEGADFNSTTRTFSWTPDYFQAGSYKVHFEVTDGYYNDSEDITITVINVNRPPKITYFAPENGSVFDEGDVITIKVIASDLDNDNIYYEIKIDNVTVSTNSSYTWETNYSSAGEHKITACVSDGSAEVSETHTIIINNVDPRWDVNEDCVVDIRDLTIVGQHFGEEFISPPYPRYDVNADGVVDISDITIVGQHFGEMTCI
ncbi:hypothetical protein CW714_08935, partial [Methanophagales archaeon]